MVRNTKHRMAHLATRCRKRAGRKLAMRMYRHVMLKAHRRIVVKDAAAALAKHELAAIPQILKELGTQYDLASPATSTRRLGDRRTLPFFPDALISRIGLRFDLRDQLFALRPALVEFFLVLRGTLSGRRLFGVHLFLFLLQSSFGPLNVGIQGFGFGHPVENAVVVFPDSRLAVIDRVLESAILLIGLRAQHLILELGNLGAFQLPVVFQALPLLVICQQRRAIGLELAQVGIQSSFDVGYMFW